MTQQQFSAELLATASALRNIRAKLSSLLAEDSLPVGSFHVITCILTDGLLVAEAMDALGHNTGMITRTPTHVDERM
jgi:hypothetical protein